MPSNLVTLIGDSEMIDRLPIRYFSEKNLILVCGNEPGDRIKDWVFLYNVPIKERDFARSGRVIERTSSLKEYSFEAHFSGCFEYVGDGEIFMGYSGSLPNLKMVGNLLKSAHRKIDEVRLTVLERPNPLNAITLYAHHTYHSKNPREFIEALSEKLRDHQEARV